MYVCTEYIDLMVNLHHSRNHLLIFLAPGDSVEPAGEIDNFGAFFGGGHYGDERQMRQKQKKKM